MSNFRIFHVNVNFPWKRPILRSDWRHEFMQKIFIWTNPPFWTTSLSELQGSDCTGRQWGNKTMATNGGKEYYKGIEPKTKHRYKEKIDLISNCDPYTIKEDKMVIERENFPSISYPAIVNNFLFALFCFCLP